MQIETTGKLIDPQCVSGGQLGYYANSISETKLQYVLERLKGLYFCGL